MNKKTVIWLAIMLLAIPSMAMPRPVDMGFDASSDDDGTIVSHYLVYVSSQPGIYDMTSGNEIANIPATGASSYTFTVDLAEAIHYLVATSVGTSGAESAPSEECKVYVGPATSTAAGGLSPTSLTVQ